MSAPDTTSDALREALLAAARDPEGRAFLIGIVREALGPVVAAEVRHLAVRTTPEGDPPATPEAPPLDLVAEARKAIVRSRKATARKRAANTAAKPAATGKDVPS